MHQTPRLNSIEARPTGAAAGDVVVESEVDRLAQPAHTDPPPRLPFTVVGVGASAGGLEAYTEFLQGCAATSGMAFVLIQHLSPKHNSMMAELLQKHTAMPVHQVEDGMKVEPDHVYMIRPGYTMTIRDGHLHLGESAAEPMRRRPIDDFFKSLAEEQRERAVAVILSGTGSNGTLGCESIKTVGGFCIAQDPESAKYPAMPRSLIDSNLADTIMRPSEMFGAIRAYAGHPYTSGQEPSADVVAIRERQALAEVLAILRARTRNDFSVYKKPTIIRRIQRRMSLLQVHQMSEYVRALRQSVAEITGLADDLMIHVTGFFRDAAVWESLRARVIQPLVAEKQDDSTIRCWVTACSSGEEAYTIGILLLEEAEKAGKHFDIKIFATDTAERSLAQARAGLFPGGIESEVTPERLERFFEKDETFYRVKKQLRELVVFAPQNVLQDPPFSRLDLCTCRNLLIYIEGDTQRRILSMLHFGLREGGTLMLGNSETISGAEGLFEPIDKQNRIYRRVGPTRHGGLDFPIPHVSKHQRAAQQLAGAGADDEPRQMPRATVQQLATKTLLDKYTPAAVVVDRGGQVLYFHGQTSLFLHQPQGEPTRELLALTREEFRGTVRSALQRAMTSEELVRQRDGTVGEGDARERAEITASPLGGPAGSNYFLVSFTLRPDPPPATLPGDGNHSAQIAEELRRVRDELQSTIEELQTSNEEMKASHEEVTSINEELQSTNEELETSKEELQSLNEELTTVNAQLEAKMQELERIGNDLSSLLSSTDIGVLFLDTQFRIRRFTPATRHLIDLIVGDAGRPLKDLAWKFDDAELMADAQAVLERLVPIEREITGHEGRFYSRKVLPYRTGDNRIDGVVVTFVDISTRKAAEHALRESEERHTFLLKLSDAVRSLDDRLQIEQVAMRLLGEQLGASRAFYFRAEPGQDGDWYHIIETDYRQDPGMQSHAGRHSVSQFGIGLFAGAERGKVVAIEDVREVGELTQAEVANYLAVDVVSFINVPLIRNGEFVAGVGAHHAVPHRWTPSEIELIREVAARTWSAVEQARAETAMRASEGKYRALFDSMDEGYCIIQMLYDADGRPDDWRFLEVNPAMEKHNGLTNATGKTIRELAPDIEPKWMQTYGRVAETGESLRFEQASQALGRTFDLYAFRVGDPDERKVAVLFTNITGRKEVEAQIQRHQQTFTDLFDRSPFGIYIVDSHFRLAHVNAAAQSGTFKNVRPLVGRDFAQAIRIIWPEPLATELVGIFHHTLETGEPYRSMDFVSPRADIGRVEGYEWELHPITLPDGTKGAICYYFDATRIRDAERAMRDSELRLRAVAENLPGGAVFLVGPDGRYELAAGQALGPAGFDSRDLEGKTLTEGLSPELAAEYEPYYRRAFAGEAFTREHAAHGRHYISHGVPLRDLFGKVSSVLAVSYDITERKRAEQALRVRESELQVLADVVPDLLWRSEPDGSTTWFNQRWLDYTGQTLEAASGWGWLDAIHPDDREAAAATYRSGVTSKTDVVQEHRIRARDGTYRWYLVHAKPLLSDAGEVIWYFGAATDIHEQRAALGAMEAAKQAAEAAGHTKDDFLATLSHELRTPISAILIWSKLLRRLTDPKQFAEGIDAIQSSAEAQKRLIEDLLDSARITSGKLRLEMQPTNLAPLVEATVDTIRPTAEGKELTLNANYGKNIGVVIADQERLRQAVWNLLANAVKFTPDGGRIEVSLTRSERHVQIKVADTGRGIAAEFLPHVFDRFRQEDNATTRRAGGLGLGLAIVRQLVEMHNGQVTAESAGPGKGATFTVTLPVARQGRRGGALPPTPPTSAPGKGQSAIRLDGLRILLIEDEPHTRNATKHLLEYAGATVDDAATPDAAMAHFNASRPDLILSDIGLPGEDGVSLLKRIRQIDEAANRTPALAVTAFAQPQDADHAREAGFHAVVIKPFEAADLLARIASVMAERARA